MDGLEAVDFAGVLGVQFWTVWWGEGNQGVRVRGVNLVVRIGGHYGWNGVSGWN